MPRWGAAGCLLLIALAAGAPRLLLAQDDSIHWAYAALYGTGVYQLEGGAETAIFSVAPGWGWRDASLDETGGRTLGYRLSFPVAIGVHDFSSLDSLPELDLDSLSTISLIPGVDIDIPMTRRWSLKALAHVGYGTAIGSADEATIFNVGIRSRFVFDLDQTTLGLVNGVERFGYDPAMGSSDAINRFTTGLEFGRPLKNLRIGGAPAAIGWHVLYTEYAETLGLDIAERQLDRVTFDAEWELGFAFHKQVGTIRMSKIQLDRIGLSYRFGDDGNFKGFGIVFKSLFDR